jgi:tetratricopeptide (TPR) repeat protein
MKFALSVSLLALCLLFLAALPALSAQPLPSNGKVSPAFTNVPALEDGYKHLYEQQFPEARAEFEAWSAEHPDEPFGQDSIAASYLYEEFYRQGVLSSDFFLDNKKFLQGIDGKPDPGRMKGFRAALANARTLANEHLATDPDDADALFALTLADGMESDADSILLKKHLDALKRMKEANVYAKQLLALRPDAYDAYIALGAANYIIGCLSGSTRFFLWFGGVHGDKQLGMEQLQKTAEDGRYLRPFAKILLALAARREKETALAQKLLHELNDEFPTSPLFAAEYAKAMGWPVPAEIRPR